MTTTAAQQPGVRAPRRDAAENRIALLEAAQLALRSDPDASLETIAATAGLTRRAVYGHYANRDELVNAVVIAGAERVAASITAVRGDDPLTTIALIGDVLWAQVDHVRIMAPLAVRGPLRSVTAAALQPVRALLLATVEAGVTDGSIRPDIDAEVLARLVESTAVGVLEEASRSELSASAGRRLVMLATLGAVGLSWQDATSVAERADASAAARAAAATDSTTIDEESSHAR